MVQEVFKRDEILEVEERSGWPSEVDRDQLRGSLKLILLQLHDKLLQKSVSTVLWSFSVWSRLERWKGSVSGCIMSWPQIKKKSSFWSVILFYSTQQWTIFDQISTKSGFYTSSDSNKINGWTQKKLQSTFQSQTCTKRRSWSLFGSLPPVFWSTIVFWILAKPLHLRSMYEMHQKLQCLPPALISQPERAQFFSMTMPNCTSHNQCFQCWTNRATKFCLIYYIHLTFCQLTTTSSSILITFCRENASVTSRRQKILSKSS